MTTSDTVPAVASGTPGGALAEIVPITAAHTAAARAARPRVPRQPGGRPGDGPARPPAPRPTRPARRPVRLTRRGRRVRALLVVLLAVGGGLLVGTAGGAQPQARTVAVHRGDTLWTIAAHDAPSDDPVRTVERIRHLNHLSGYTIYPGQRLVLPA